MFNDRPKCLADLKRWAAAFEGSMEYNDHFQEEPLPLLYSCSGCSSAGQMANALALRMDREQIVEMSCIAGIGGDVPALLRKARSGRPLLVIDGCPLQCALHSLRQRGLKPDAHVKLSRLGVPKESHQDYAPELAAQIYGRVKEQLIASPVKL